MDEAKLERMIQNSQAIQRELDKLDELRKRKQSQQEGDFLMDNQKEERAIRNSEALRKLVDEGLEIQRRINKKPA